MSPDATHNRFVGKKLPTNQKRMGASFSHLATTKRERDTPFVYFQMSALQRPQIIPHLYIFWLRQGVFGAAPWHVEVPRLGVKLELQLPAYTTATAHLYFDELLSGY